MSQDFNAHTSIYIIQMLLHNITKMLNGIEIHCIVSFYLDNILSGIKKYL